MKILIFAGGNGTRLWPVSRVKTPKQFQTLVGKKSLFELTVERMLKRFDWDDIYIVIPEIYKNTVKKYYPDIKDDHLIIEPFKWDTLACIGYACFVIHTKFPEETIFMVWSDHIIKNEERFLDVIEVGDAYVKKTGKVVRIGAKTTYPETNWGYIKFGDQIDKMNGIDVYAFEQQYEKPEYSVAKKFVESFEYLWNMGYMIWPAAKLIEAYQKYSPLSFKVLTKIADPSFHGDIVEEYKKITKNSIDYEILEKMQPDEAAVIPADVGWNDVGDWASLKNQLEEEKNDLVFIGEQKDTYIIDSEDTIVYSNNKKKTICLIGVADLAVIDTGDVLLVCSKKRSRDVKKIVESLAEKRSALC